MSEILGALFKYVMMVLGVAAVGAVGYQVMYSNKTSRGLSDLTTMQNNISSHYDMQSSFATLTNTAVINGGWAPPTMVSGGALVNPWGGTVTVAVNSGNSTLYDVTETKVSTDACTTMLTGLSNAVAISVNGAAQTLPVDPASAALACKGASNTVLITSGR